MTLPAVTWLPVWVAAAFHAWVTVWPFAYCQVTVQPLIELVPAVTCTEAWNPPGHWLTTL